MTSIFIRACPQDLDDKAMSADRTNHSYSCEMCGRMWYDERITRGVNVVFLGYARSSWRNSPDNLSFVKPAGSHVWDDEGKHGFSREFLDDTVRKVSG